MTSLNSEFEFGITEKMQNLILIESDFIVQKLEKSENLKNVIGVRSENLDRDR